jgi:hypothetical protein
MVLSPFFITEGRKYCFTRFTKESSTFKHAGPPSLSYVIRGGEIYEKNDIVCRYRY